MDGNCGEPPPSGILFFPYLDTWLLQVTKRRIPTNDIMAPLSGSAKKKKQKEKERELQRLKVIEERQAGSDTSPDEEIPATQPYGPWEEPKEKWDARLEAQPPAEKYSEFEKRAKARKGQPIEYQPAAISDEQTLHVDASTKFDSTAKPVQKLVFVSGINLDEYG